MYIVLLIISHIYASFTTQTFTTFKFNSNIYSIFVDLFPEPLVQVELTFELLDVLGRRIDDNVLVDVRTVIVESDQKVIRDVHVASFDLVHHPLGQVKDGVLVGLHRTGRVHQEGQRRVEDVLADGHGTVHAVASHAAAGTSADAVRV